MKKLFTVLLLIIYFTVSTGFVVSMHYCMNELSSAKIGDHADDYCDKCGMETDGRCCWDEVKVVKLQFQHTIAKLIQAAFSVPVVPVNHTAFLLAPLNNFTPDTDNTIAHSPPLPEQDTYLKNCVFRI